MGNWILPSRWNTISQTKARRFLDLTDFWNTTAVRITNILSTNNALISGENENIYSVFVKLGDCLIWEQDHWKVVSPGEASLHHPLLVVKKADERLMTFELWDVEGKGKILLNLLKSTESWTMQNPQNLQRMFKFVGARTRTQCVFEINGERMVLCPFDWLLLTPKGWKKLSLEDEIDNYVKRKITGTLFVFEGISRKEERQMLKGILYSPTRTDFQSVELALQVGGIKPTAIKEAKEAAETHGERAIPLIRSDEVNQPAVKTPPVGSSKEQLPNR